MRVSDFYKFCRLYIIKYKFINLVLYKNHNAMTIINGNTFNVNISMAESEHDLEKKVISYLLAIEVLKCSNRSPEHLLRAWRKLLEMIVSTGLYTFLTWSGLKWWHKVFAKCLAQWSELEEATELLKSKILFFSFHL